MINEIRVRLALLHYIKIGINIQNGKNKNLTIHASGRQKAVPLNSALGDTKRVNFEGW